MKIPKRFHLEMLLQLQNRVQFTCISLVGPFAMLGNVLPHGATPAAGTVAALWFSHSTGGSLQSRVVTARPNSQSLSEALITPKYMGFVTRAGLLCLWVLKEKATFSEIMNPFMSSEGVASF